MASTETGSNSLQHLPAHAKAVQNASTMLRNMQPELSESQAAHMTLSLLGACYAHLTYGRAFGLPLGLDPDHPQFIAERRAHLRHVLLALLP